MVCFRYIIVNTLHKYDNKEEEDDADNNNILTFSYNTMHRSFNGLLSFFTTYT